MHYEWLFWFNFNSHAHVERDLSIWVNALMEENFNSHAHVERDTGRLEIIYIWWISTHTLTWSVTAFLLSSTFTILVISTHTLTWSVTYIALYGKSHKYISTHTLTWSVTLSVTEREVRENISTHTLTWSVTDKPQQYLQIVTNFNSHAHVERDHAKVGKWPACYHFNSHAHVERDGIGKCC